MESNWAAEHLQVIRTLMERSAIYRRAMAPIMTFLGALGTIGAIVGVTMNLDQPRQFILFWGSVSILAMAGSFLLVRRQALKDAEPFWSPPTRRVTQAVLPPFAAGFALGAVAWTLSGSAPDNLGPVIAMLWLPLGWVILYGCAFHAAGFFMPRGMRLFGWIFVVAACGLLACGIPDAVSRASYAHGIMGVFFGILHLAYGVYLYFTEQRKNAA